MEPRNPPIPAADLVRDTIANYTASKTSPHEQLSRLDFTARLALGLSAHAATANASESLGLKPSPGIGALRTTLEKVQARCPPSFAGIARAGLQLLDTRVVGHETWTVERLRNHLFHGGNLPTEQAAGQAAADLDRAIQKASDQMFALLQGASFEEEPAGADSGGAPTAVPIQLHYGGTCYPLGPLLALIGNSFVLLVFARLTSAKIIYTAARQHPVPSGERAPQEALVQRLFDQTPLDRYLADLTEAVCEDLRGFSELQSRLYHMQEGGAIVVDWQFANRPRATHRRDCFRIGYSNAWEWRPEGAGSNDWRPYPTLFRELSDWSGLKDSLSKSLRDQMDKIRFEEELALPLPPGIPQPPIEEVELRIGLMDQPGERSDLQGFAERLSCDVQANRGVTYLYFLHAEAGAGKTTALLRMAQQRAANPDNDLPLFMYVSARGNVFDDLSKAVDAAVVDTQRLTSRSVKVLCRNGLLILVVDGFDELLGSRKYDDPLAELRPWLRELGGRGVLVVSARSSYYLGLYKESFEKRSNRDIVVEHLLVKLDKWSAPVRDAHLQGLGVSPQVLSSLPDDERELLRLPFFARASLQHLRSTATPSRAKLLFQLISDYAQREQKKLRLGENQDLVRSSELESLFTELAGWMLENNTREVPLEDLLFLAQYALNHGDKAEVQKRMQAICGLEGTVKRFRFAHEVFFDFFVGRFVAQQARDPVALKKTLGNYKLTPSAARVLWRIAELSPAVLEGLTNGWESPLPANVGQLWTSLFGIQRRIDGAHIRRARFGEVDLREVQVGTLTFSGCQFARLTLPRRRPGALRFASCTLTELTVPADGQGLIFDDCQISTLLSPACLVEDPYEIHQQLSRAGATTSGEFARPAAPGMTLAPLAAMFLQRLETRLSSALVLRTDFLPEDDKRQNWIRHHADAWKKVVDALLIHRLAFTEGLQAEGRAKLRLKFAISVSTILEARQGTPRSGPAGAFWDALDREVYA